MFKRIAQVFFVLVVMLLVGCATSSPWILSDSVVSNKEEVDFPNVGSLNTEGLGDTLVSKGYKSTTPSLRILDRWEWKEYGISRTPRDPKYHIAANTVSKRKLIGSNVSTGESWLCYEVEIRFLSPEPPNTALWPLCKTNEGSFKFFHELGAGPRYRIDPPFNGRYEEMDVVDVTKPSYIQEFIYNGRVDNSLKFIYREFSDDYLRPSFTQEVQYDLNLSSEIGFKDLKLEVIEATNTEITYKLISNF